MGPLKVVIKPLDVCVVDVRTGRASPTGSFLATFVFKDLEKVWEESLRALIDREDSLREGLAGEKLPSEMDFRVSDLFKSPKGVFVVAVVGSKATKHPFTLSVMDRFGLTVFCMKKFWMSNGHPNIYIARIPKKFMGEEVRILGINF